MVSLLQEKDLSLLEKIQKVKEMYPDLTASGFDLKKQFSDFESERRELENYLVEVEICLSFLKLVFKSSQIDYFKSSYGYKHVVEKWTLTKYGRRIYIPNGTFIMAAIIAGFKISEPISDSPNVYFNIMDKTTIPRLELNEEVKYKNYNEKIVCYFDILGWKEKIQKTEHDPAETGKIIKIYTNCKKIFADYVKVNSNEFKINMTSDSFFISWYSEKKNNRKVFNIIKMMVQAMAYQEYLMRGAINLGNIIHDNDIIFGTALTEAYLLEKNCAVYPRIIFSKKISEEMIKPTITRNSLNSIKTKSYETDSDVFNYIDYFAFMKDSRIPDLSHDEPQENEIEQEEYYVKLRYLISKYLESEDPSINMKYQWMKDKFNKAIDIYVVDKMFKKSLKIDSK